MSPSDSKPRSWRQRFVRNWRQLFTRPPKDEEREYECMKKCWESLSLQQQEIVLELMAHRNDDNARKIRHRRELAAKLGITYSDLRDEVRRMRAEVQECMHKCLSEIDYDSQAGA